VAFIQVYFNDVLQGEVPLRTDASDPVSIGRDPDNDIVIDNAGVSGLHAAIWQEGGRFVVGDTASKNGVVVNGELTHRKVLELGDTIQLLKYSLKFVDQSAGVAFPRPAEQSAPVADQKRTIEVDISRLGDLKKRTAARGAATLRVSGKGGMPGEFLLNKVTLKIGRAPSCDVRVGGWFAPALAASIVRRSDGYHLQPEKGARLRVNGARLAEPRKLEHGDTIAVRGTEMTFHDNNPTPAARASS
jgi:pSer/pThr/pTyr-binding forkhead associated (FHA) protein